MEVFKRANFIRMCLSFDSAEDAESFRNQLIAVYPWLTNFTGLDSHEVWVLPGAMKEVYEYHARHEARLTK